MKIRRILSVFLLVAILCGLIGLPQAYAVSDPGIKAKAALLVDADTGHVLYQNMASAEHSSYDLEYCFLLSDDDLFYISHQSFDLIIHQISSVSEIV